MYMYPSPAIEAVRKFARVAGASLDEGPAALVLRVTRNDVIVTLTVPRDVLEWFVDVADAAGVVTSDWCDYEGYDDTPRELLHNDMATDVEQFLVAITSRPIRIVRAARAKPRLEWFHETRWCGAVPSV
jgi:hypothetical protein